jgi:POT family proton-dependent oligopeptide transporter
MIDSQPKALYLLFFTELWERFGFYTVQTILILYVTHALGYSDTNADLLYGAFSALLYLTPAIGGYIADRYIGFKRAIIIGGLLLFLGYLITGLPGEKMFFIGLGVLIVANGLFKPNVSSIVGTLYEPNDPRRDSGFTLFYMGINIGAFIPPLFIGTVVQHYGWHIGFLFAAAGMLIGMLTFWFGRKHLENKGGIPEFSPLARKQISAFSFYTLLTLGIAFAIYIVQFSFSFPKSTNLIVVIGSIIIFLAVIYFMLKENREQRNRMIACLILIAISVGFWALYNQTFTSLMLFADRNMDVHFLGFKIDAEFTQFFNPFFIVALSPVLSWLWIGFAKKKINPSTPTKFAIGVLCIALGFLILAFASSFFGHNGLTSPWWLVLNYFFQTVGELFLSPVGLAMITVLSPRRLVGMMMGVWFLSQSAAFAIGGGLATLAAIPQNLTTVASLPIYAHAFLLYGSITTGLTIISFALVPFLKRLIQGTNLQTDI